ncbi:MAG TPA: hypothetical protein VGF93_15850 [Solirubrobacteraceae bacterium]|jgi:hypothetical protein
MTAIDVHAHVIVAEMLRSADSPEAWRPAVRDDGGHPALRVLLAHGGGAIVALRGRLRYGSAHVVAAGRGLGEPADASIGRFLFDTVTHDPAVLRGLVEAVGADRVLHGNAERELRRGSVAGLRRG